MTTDRTEGQCGQQDVRSGGRRCPPPEGHVLTLRGLRGQSGSAIDRHLQGNAAAGGVVVLEAGVKSVNERAISPTLPAWPDRVHHIAEPNAGVRISEAQRSPRPEVAEASEIRSEGSVGPRRLEAEAECRVSLEDRAPALRLRRGRLGEEIGVEDGDPIDCTACSQSGVQARHAAGGCVQVGRRHLRGSPRLAVHHADPRVTGVDWNS